MKARERFSVDQLACGRVDVSRAAGMMIFVGAALRWCSRVGVPAVGSRAALAISPALREQPGRVCGAGRTPPRTWLPLCRAWEKGTRSSLPQGFT